MGPLVATDWLAERLGDDDLSILDCSLFMPASGRNAEAEFHQAHIPGALFLDLDAVVDRSDPAPHMLPPAEAFAATMAALGVGSAHRVIVYDNSPLRSAARGWFMLRHFGAEAVAILDGGLGKWQAEGRPVESGPARQRPAARFDVRVRKEDVVAKSALLAGLGAPVLDARGAGRFAGTEADPRPGVAAGHIPGARNLPFGKLYREDGTFRDADELAALFADAGIDPARPFVASCGSGVTASALILAAHLLGQDSGRLYDGSWAEWGADPATPKALGTD